MDLRALAKDRAGREPVELSIIGAGNLGRAIATSATRVGHDVTITASNAANAETTARQLGVHWA
ncbi:MAG: NAD(P)-binding domain-containing protein, partial [Solirubrobacterales bacterium]